MPLVHAFYGKYREDLLESGVQLYEFLATPAAEALNENNEEISKKPKSASKD